LEIFFFSEMQPSNTLVKEVLSMIGGFARGYSRELELRLEDLQLPELTDQLRQLTQDWQQQAVLSHILAHFLREALLDEICLSLLKDFLNLIDPSVEIVQRVISELAQLSTENRLSSAQKAFLLALCRRLEMANWPALLAWFQMKFGAADWLQGADFEASFIEALNRAALSAEGAMDETTVAEFYLLALQNGSRTVESLLQAAVQNAGQIQTVVSILHRPLDPICSQTDPSGGQVTVLSRQLVDLLQTKQDKELENVIETFFALARENSRYAAEVFLSLPEILSKCWSRGAFSDCLVFANVLVRSLSDTSILRESRQSHVSVLTAAIILVQIVNSSVHMLDHVADMFALREVCLNGLNLLLGARRSVVEPILERLLSPTFRAYFFPSSNSLLSIIQNAHFNKNPEKVIERSSSNIIEESVLVLPLIMRNEWQHLFEVSCMIRFLS
jgi:hypothetical protein